MKTIIVLNFETAEVKIITNVNPSELKNREEEWLLSKGFNSSNCQWMIVRQLKLEIV